MLVCYTKWAQERRFMSKIEEYIVRGNSFVKRINKRDGSFVESSIPIASEGVEASPSGFDIEWLKLRNRPTLSIVNPTKLNLVDLFCGMGPMTLGVVEAGRCLGIDITPVFAVDFESDAANHYRLNFPTARVENADIFDFIDGNFGDDATEKEKNLLKSLPRVDFLIGGPPCQGFSDLNNHTRRDDPRNTLIFRMVRFAELAQPDYIIIENVQGIRHDKKNALGVAKENLRKLGYHLHDNLLMASDFGVAQNRRRFLLVATKRDLPSYDLSQYVRSTPTSCMWAFGDLLDHSGSTDNFDTPATLYPVNQKRLDYLFEHGLYELPNHLRPKCQQSESNRYTSVYSRMYPDKPAPTITSGFGSIGQGRFGHPLVNRTITPHEAARIQFIPDFFNFIRDTKRFSMQKMIGNAVPPKLTYVLALEILR